MHRPSNMTDVQETTGTPAAETITVPAAAGRSARDADAGDHALRRAPTQLGQAPAGPVDDGESANAVNRLLDDSWDQHLAPFDRRQRLAGTGLSLVFLLCASALAALGPSFEPRAGLPLILAVAVAFAVASRVEFPIGAGYAVPTQLFLVPLFLLAPPILVPLIVLGAHAAAAAADALLRRAPADRLVDVGVDSWHSLAPALVITAAGAPDPSTMPLWLPFAAFGSQVAGEVATSSLRLWFGLGIPPTLQLRVLLPVWLIDALLTPIGVIAGAATSVPGLAGAPLALIGLLGLLMVLTRDRTERINQAHARLEALRAERSRLEVAVQRIGDAFASKLDLDALLGITTRAAVEALAADGARASANPGPGRKLVRRATVRETADLGPALMAAERAAIRNGTLAFATVNEICAVACPVSEPGADHPAAGVIAVARRAGPFADRKQQLLRYLCEQAGVAAADIQRHELLHRQALSDDLTGLANHRRLQEVLALGTTGFATSGTPLALILFDLDNFKAVNDTRGHQTGDHVLRAVADVLRGCCRTGDEPARYGGEELAIVVHASELDAVVAIAERARARIEALELVDTAGETLSVTTSIGVAELGPDLPDPRALIAAADEALYAAKRGGKNRVCVAGWPPTEEGQRAEEASRSRR